MKKLASWWWIDRWRKSTAYTDMTAEQQGVYRNLLDELWLRGGVIPADERILAKIGGDPEAWPRVREVVLARFYTSPEGLRHETHDEVASYGESQQRKGRQRAQSAPRKGGRFASRTPAGPPAEHQPDRQPEPPAEHQPPSPYSVSVLRTPSPLPAGMHPVAAPANPLVAGRRAPLETEAMRLARQIAEAEDRDPLEVMAEGADYPGARGPKVDPASMTDNRLAATVLALRRRAEQLRPESVPVERLRILAADAVRRGVSADDFASAAELHLSADDARTFRQLVAERRADGACP